MLYILKEKIKMPQIHELEKGRFDDQLNP